MILLRTSRCSCAATCCAQRPSHQHCSVCISIIFFSLQNSSVLMHNSSFFYTKFLAFNTKLIIFTHVVGNCEPINTRVNGLKRIVCITDVNLVLCGNHRCVDQESSFSIEESLKNLHFLVQNHHLYILNRSRRSQCCGFISFEIQNPSLLIHNSSF